MISRPTNENAWHQVTNILSQEGIRAAIIFMNGLTPHRFTALYRFDREALKNLYFFDRLNPDIDFSPEIPVMASYCVFVRDSERPFLIENSLEDDRTTQHPKRQVVKSYCGVPLLDRDGKMFGTICHFDMSPQLIRNEDVELMEKFADLLQKQFSAT